MNLVAYRRNSFDKIHIVEKLIFEYFLRCQNLSGIEKNNIILLFYHELIHFYASIIVRNEILNHRNKQKNKSKINLHKFMDDEVRFGWRNRKSLFDLIKNKKKISIKRRLLSFIFSTKLFWFKDAKIYIGDVSINNFSIIFRSFLRGYRIAYISNDQVYLNEAKKQTDLIFELTNEINRKINVNFDCEQLKKDIQYSISCIISEDYLKVKKYKKKDFIIIGSPGKFYNRIASINGYCSGSKIIGVLHGEESGSVSHLPWKFDDRSLSQFIIGYGSKGNYKNNRDANFLSIDKLNQTYVESDSEYVSKIFDNSKIKFLNTKKANKGLYISWRLNNISVINSYDTMDPLDYIEWQNFLLKKYPDVAIKLHPKQRNFINYKSKKVFGSLIDCIDDYDYFIFDYASSSAFSQVAATNKPIIYYNLGLSNYTNNGLSYLRKRVIWCDVNVYQNYDGFLVFNKNNDKKDNSFTKSFSLASKKTSRIDALFNTIEANKIL